MSPHSINQLQLEQAGGSEASKVQLRLKSQESLAAVTPCISHQIQLLVVRNIWFLSTAAFKCPLMPLYAKLPDRLRLCGSRRTLESMAAANFHCLTNFYATNRSWKLWQQTSPHWVSAGVLRMWVS